MMSTHRQRWATGLVALPLIYLLVVAGGALFVLLIAAVSYLTLWEFYRVAFYAEPEHGPVRLAPILGMILTPVIVWLIYRHGMTLAMLVVAVDLVLVAGLTLPLYKSDHQAPLVVAKQVFGLVYIPIFLSFLVMIRFGESGSQWIFWILCIVAGGDIGAFYSGTYLGRHKLCPWISPKKTIEGSIGGLVSNVLVALLFKLALLPEAPVLPSVVLAVVVGAAGQVGDLFASEFKRSAGVKDSGNLLPGHGGFLDRLDALLFASPLAYLLKTTIF